MKYLLVLLIVLFASPVWADSEVHFKVWTEIETKQCASVICGGPPGSIQTFDVRKLYIQSFEDNQVKITDIVINNNHKCITESTTNGIIMSLGDKFGFVPVCDPIKVDISTSDGKISTFRLQQR